ncbi:PTR2-domain-containing protein [Basidiobolus meristosporus CBS 931.73]|uniref:PTR2-domain-containing protein n=1 Tax=Basidiobolus meristosporus CBS 931.73 TaxID=1314790 RepID=A0A1Y1W9L4_9FUNG|nr:PTR2-domain-containing protein [Basidiobolus meristosporus CBS 931.73]ORX85646.1 PTR2-domain-containing protein [Basidiobolus meristosporus CBS 931.73]|eukprot:ORX69844.1 PTR2-domain-containing protein [Basidiobolus meristosporus CBS 931.73]
MEIGAADEDQLTSREKELLRLERELNAKLDQQLLENPNKIPKAVWYIIPNEFCERFTFYGIKNLLQQYFKTAVGLNPVQAKVNSHAFNMMCYFFPLLGAAISDSWLAKYHTIVYLSVVYLIGTILLAVFSINGLISNYGAYPVWTAMLPLTLIALGTGGIKPCVSSHGGDQYLPHQTKALDWFFAMFYISINSGSLLSQYITPMLKDKVSCFGSQCYFASFALPAALFAIALVIFVLGFKHYRVVPAIGEFLPWKAIKGTVYAIKKYSSATPEERQRRGNWLNFAEDLVGPLFVEEIRMFGQVFGMILPIMFWWMIYDQQSTEWQEQYEMMNKNWGSLEISTEQSSIFNTIFILIFVPLCAKVLYPFLERRGIRFYLLRRMAVGFFLVILSFALSGGLQYIVQSRFDGERNASGKVTSCPNCLHGAWQLPQWALLSLGETMVSPTGLQFTYTQVGRQMKSTSSSFWLLTVSLGNLVVTAIEEGLAGTSIQGPPKYFLYCGIGLVANIVFCFLATKYTYKEDKDAKLQEAAQEKKGMH